MDWFNVTQLTRVRAMITPGDLALESALLMTVALPLLVSFKPLSMQPHKYFQNSPASLFLCHYHPSLSYIHLL